MTQGARILIADDEPQIRRSLQVNLKSKSYDSLLTKGQLQEYEL